MTLQTACTVGNGGTTGAAFTLATTGWSAQHGSGSTAPQPGDLVLITAQVQTTTAGTWSQTGGAPCTFHSTGDLNATLGGQLTFLAWRIWDGSETASPPAFTCTQTGRWQMGACAIRPDPGNTVSADAWAADLIDTASATTHTANQDTAAGASETSVITHLVTATATGTTAITQTAETNWTSVGSRSQAGSVSTYSQFVAFADRSGQSGTVTPGAYTTSVATVANFYHLLAAQAPIPVPAASARPGQTWLRRFHHRQNLPQPLAAAAPAAPAGTVTFAAPRVRPAAHRAALGARGALAAGILAAGIGPPAVPAPHQPPAIAHPAPHRALWRSGQGQPPTAAALGAAQPFRPVTVWRRAPHGVVWRPGQGVPPGAAPQKRYPVTIYPRIAHRASWRSGQGSPPNAVQQVKIPPTVWRRAAHGAAWRSGRGAVPAALPQPSRPPTIFTRVPHRALWRSGAGTAAGAVLGTGTPQPFRPTTVFTRRPHAAAWRAGQGAPPGARPQPFRPVTVYPRAARRVLWRAVTGPPPAAVVSLGGRQPFKPVTVYARKLHGAAWRAVTGRPPSPAPQPFKPVTVWRRVPHAAAWRSVTGRPPAAVRQPRIPGTVFTRLRHRVLWRAGAGSPAPPPPPFTVGALTAATAPQGTLTAAGTSGALTATTAPQGTLTAADSPAGTAAYGAVYGPVYGPQEGTLTGADTRTGGPG